MSIAVPLNGFGTGGNNQVLINVVGGLTQPENPKYGTIWIRTSTPVNGWEVFPVTPAWEAEEGHVYIQNVPATDGNIPSFSALDYWRKPYGAIWLRLSGAMQRVNGAWVRQDAWVWRDNVWTQFSATRNTPEFTYTGDYAIVDDNDNAISDFATWTGNWKIRFLTSGTLTFTNLNGAEGGIDVFLVGGGASGGGRGGGGGGYTKTQKSVSVSVGAKYPIVIGAGGSGPTTSNRVPPNAGGLTSAFGLTANGGSTSSGGDYPSPGGSGGGSGRVGGAGYSGGSDGSNGSGGDGGKGQGTTTREFGEVNGTLYAGGGGGGAVTTHETSSGGAGGGGDGGGVGADPRPKNGDANTGGGGGGIGNISGTVAYASGGSGIVIIRNKR